MKTIKERAKEYAIDYMNKYDLVGSARIETDIEDLPGILGNVFIAGAQSEHEELTRWNENLDEVPDGYNKWCIVKIQDKDGFVSYTVALALWGKFCMPDLMNGEKIVGWREIHE